MWRSLFVALGALSALSASAEYIQLKEDAVVFDAANPGGAAVAQPLEAPQSPAVDALQSPDAVSVPLHVMVAEAQQSPDAAAEATQDAVAEADLTRNL